VLAATQLFYRERNHREITFDIADSMTQPRPKSTVDSMRTSGQLMVAMIQYMAGKESVHPTNTSAVLLKFPIPIPDPIGVHLSVFKKPWHKPLIKPKPTLVYMENYYRVRRWHYKNDSIALVHSCLVHGCGTLGILGTFLDPPVLVIQDMLSGAPSKSFVQRTCT
jgi:hypothetical protein